MEDSDESRGREHEAQEFIALLDRIECEKKYRKEMKGIMKKDPVKNSRTWLSSFKWEDFNKDNNVQHPSKSEKREKNYSFQSEGNEVEEQQGMKRKRESSPAENIGENKRSSSKENNKQERVIAGFDLNVEGESEIPSSMGLSL